MKRDTRPKRTTRLVNFWAPELLIAGIGEAAQVLDVDKSKFIRSAIREKLHRNGIRVPTSATK